MLIQLKSIGLSDKEAKVYLAMLELGPSSMLEIAAKAGVNRPTAYVQIESLKKMGLVSTQTKGKKHLFIAEDPEQLGIVIDREKKFIEQKKDSLTEILPELKNIFHLAGEQPQVRFFEGKEGIEKMLQEFLKTKEKIIYGISSRDDVVNALPLEEFKIYAKERVKKKIHSKWIYTSKEGPIGPEQEEEFLSRQKYISSEKLPFSADITIFDDSVAISALRGKLSGAIIQHKEIANSFRGLFDFVWQLTDKI